MVPIPNNQQIDDSLLKKLLNIWYNEKSASLIKEKQIIFCINQWENIKNEKKVWIVVNFRSWWLTLGTEDVTGLPKTDEKFKRLVVVQIPTLEYKDGIW